MNEVYHVPQRRHKKFPPAQEGYKFCNGCEKELILSAFTVKNGKPYSQCIECVRERDRRRSQPVIRERSTKRRVAPKSTKPGYRFCAACLNEQTFDQFHHRKGKPDGLCYTCLRQIDKDRQQLRRHRQFAPLPKSVTPGNKVCNTCLIERPFFEFAKDPAQKDGFRGRCRTCYATLYHERSDEEKKAQSEHRRVLDTRNRRRKGVSERRKKAPKKVRVPLPIQQKLTKICPKCDPPQEKFLSDFPLDKNRKDGRYFCCLECQRTIANSEKSKARRRAYERNKNSNPHYRRVQQNARNAWRRKNPLSQRELTLRRNARKRAATIGKVSFRRVLERDGYWCYLCQCPILSHHKLSFDHVIPITPRPGEPQGTHSEDNIRPTHKECNARKLNKRLEDLTPYDLRGVE